MPDPFVADPYIEVADLRARLGGDFTSSTPEFDDDALAALVSEFEEIAEDYLGVAFVEREGSESFTLAAPAASIMLAQPQVRELTGLTIDGDEVDLDAEPFTLYGPVGRVEGTFPSLVPIVFGYTYGFTAPTPTLVRAGVQYVRSCALVDRSRVARDALSVADGSGGTTRYSTPNKAERRPTGYLEVDRLLNSMPQYQAPGVS